MTAVCFGVYARVLDRSLSSESLRWTGVQRLNCICVFRTITHMLTHTNWFMKSLAEFPSYKLCIYTRGSIWKHSNSIRLLLITIHKFVFTLCCRMCEVFRDHIQIISRVEIVFIFLKTAAFSYQQNLMRAACVNSVASTGAAAFSALLSCEVSQ